MDLNEQDISLMDRYLAGELKGDELAAFEARMASDATFSEEVKLHRDLIAAVRQDARKGQKEKLAAMGAALIAAGEIKPYTPSQGGGGEPPASGGSSIIRWLFSLVITAAVGAGVYYFFFYRPGGEAPGSTLFEQMQQSGGSHRVDTIIRVDTTRIQRGAPSPGESSFQPKDGSHSSSKGGSATEVRTTTVQGGTQTIVKVDTQVVNLGEQPPTQDQNPPQKPKKGATGKFEEGPK